MLFLVFDSLPGLLTKQTQIKKTKTFLIRFLSRFDHDQLNRNIESLLSGIITLSKNAVVQMCFVTKVFLKILQKSLESTSARVSPVAAFASV